MLISVLGDRGGERDRLGVNPFAADGRGFGFSLPKQDEELDDRAKGSREVGFAFAGVPNPLQLVVGKNARAARLAERSDADDRVVGQVAALPAPIEEDHGDGAGMIVFCRRFLQAIEPLDDLGMGDVGKLTFEGEML